MALTYPYALTVLADILPIQSVTWDIKRNDQISGSGDARFWQAELSDPLWTAEVTLDKVDRQRLREVAALIRKLHGAQESFWLYDPVSKYPKADPKGTILGDAAVKVAAIGENNSSISLKGLPAGYTLTIGDKGRIAFGDDQSFFFEVDETVSADADGLTPQFEIFPHVPAGLAADDAVTLAKPACEVFIMPGSHKPGTARRFVIEGAGFTVMERRR